MTINKWLIVGLLWLLVLVATAVISHAQTTPTQTLNFDLTWIDNSANEDGFNIERAPAQTGPFVKIGSVLSNMIKYTDTITGDTGGKQYCYRVAAFNTAGQSAYSNIACQTSPIIVVPPAPPSGLGISLSVQ